MCSTEKKLNNNLIRLKASGQMVAEQANTLIKAFKKELTDLSEGSSVVLDLQKVTRIDSRGISLCVGLFKECTPKNIDFSIEAGPESFRILQQIKLDKLLNIREIPFE